MTTSAWAASHAGELLSPLGDRWRHVQGVARQAQRVAAILPADDRDVLLAAELAEFEDEASATSMALTYCDMTTGAVGERVSLAERLADVERRHGAGHIVTRSLRQATPELERCVQQVEASLRSLARS